MTRLPPKTKEVVFKYLDTPFAERQPVKDFLKENRLQRVSLYKGELLYATEKSAEEKDARLRMLKKREAADKLGDMITPEEDKWASMEKAIYEKGLAGTVKAQELYAKIKGKIKPEELDVKIGLSADEIARRNLEAERQLREEDGHRVEKVPEEPSLLS
tara:strand:+ start:141 stop:617 length:477 start_codon:yes stop_codon:yes gene_type:complete